MSQKIQANFYYEVAFFFSFCLNTYPISQVSSSHLSKVCFLLILLIFKSNYQLCYSYIFYLSPTSNNKIYTNERFHDFLQMLLKPLKRIELRLFFFIGTKDYTWTSYLLPMYFTSTKQINYDKATSNHCIPKSK